MSEDTRALARMPEEPSLETVFNDSEPLLCGSRATVALAGRPSFCGHRVRVALLSCMAFMLSLASLVLCLGVPSGSAPPAKTASSGFRTATTTGDFRGERSLASAGVQVVNGGTGMCLDWGPIIVNIMDCNPEREMQLWTYSVSDHHIITHDGRCMDGGGKFVHVWGCSPLLPQNQQWMYDASTGQIFYYVNTDVTCLAANLTSISQEICDMHSKEQQWRFMHVAEPVTTSIAAASGVTTTPEAETY